MNFHGPQHELYHLTMRDSSFRERPESDKHWGRKKEEKRRTGKWKTGLALPAGLFEAVTVSPWKRDGV